MQQFSILHYKPNHFFSKPFFSQPFKAGKPRLCDLFHFLKCACEDRFLMNLYSKSKHLSISWVQNKKVLHNRSCQGHKHVTKPCMSKTFFQVLHHTKPFCGHCHILSSPVRQVLSWLCSGRVLQDMHSSSHPAASTAAVPQAPLTMGASEQPGWI